MAHEVWLSLKRSIQCKPHNSEVHDPKEDKHQINAQRKELQGNKKNSEKLENCSTKSKVSRDNNLKPITHEIVLDPSNGEVKFCPCCPFPQSDRGSKRVERPHKSKGPSTASRETHHVDAYNECYISSRPNTPSRVLLQTDSTDPLALSCENCNEKLKNLDATEAHHISKHSITELHEEDSSWKIIETICQTSSKNPESNSWKIGSVLKVQNTHKAFSSFEEHREVIKMNAEKLQKNKHARCLADGNELLRFYGTTMSCSLGLNGSSSLCTLGHCGICQILRHGFSTNKEFCGELGVFTTSTSAKAFESIGSSNERITTIRKCVVVCRVIAGRVRSSLEEIQEMDDLGFDSLAGKICCHLDFEELYVLNPKALLPCFVVIYKS